MRSIVDITELLPGGEGVGHIAIKGERRAVFVSGVARGEKVDVELDPQTRPARGTLLRVVSAAAARAAPPCAYVAKCGGCDWMHLTPSAQMTEHAAIVGKLLGVEVTARAPANATRYRTRARVHLEADARTGAVIAGMYERKSRTPVAVAECIVLDPAIDGARLALATWLAGARGRGEVQLALGAERKPVLELRWFGSLPGETFGRLERAVTAGELAGARVFAGDVTVPATIGDPTPILRGADGESLRLAPGGFAQASEEGNALLARRVAELALGAGAGARTVELYAGAGNLTVLLARSLDVIAVESDGPACAATRANLAARALTAKVVAQDAASFVIPRGTRLVVLDPPREGARAVCAAIATTKHAKLTRIVYVSCDPPTLARDVKTLQEGGWTIATAETFEMFPHTSHVETVVSLVKG